MRQITENTQLENLKLRKIEQGMKKLIKDERRKIKMHLKQTYKIKH